ncbi:MAG: ROK family protein [Treponema sp.]|jgi:glucokinase|nr:ROK family protein [Treponema sp.]
MAEYLGFDIGGTKCAVVAAEADWKNSICRIIDKYRISTAGKKWNSILDLLGRAAKDIILKNDLHPVSAGISCGGPLDRKKGIVLSPPNLPGWDNVPVTAYMEQQLNIPVYLQNDANACALAEWKFGAGRDYKNVLFLTFGTGMGAGLILNGKIYEGFNGYAGEIGHIRLEKNGPVGNNKAGSFEGFCSGGGLVRLAEIEMKKARKSKIESALFSLSAEQLSAQTIATAADNGDFIARKIYEISAEKLGEGLSILIDILNPECIIIGSIFCRSEHLFREKMEQVLRKESLLIPYKACKILPAALSDQLGDFAAIAVACGDMNE